MNGFGSGSAHLAPKVSPFDHPAFESLFLSIHILLERGNFEATFVWPPVPALQDKGSLVL